MSKRLNACVCLLFLIAGCGFADDTIAKLSSEAIGYSPSVALSPSGQSVAMQDQSGAIWLIDSNGTRKKLLVRGKEPVGLAWSANNKILLAIHDGSVASYDMPSGRLRGSFVGSTPFSDPQVSPDGQCIAAVRNHNLWLANCGGKALHPLTTEGSTQLLIGEPDQVYAYEFGAPKHYWWAPDSSAIALIETKFAEADHYPLPGGKLPSFQLKIIDVRTGVVRTIAGSNEEWPYLLRVAWHPDSRRLVFYRMNRLQNAAELLISDGETQQKVLSEKDDYWVNTPETPVFLTDGQRVVVSSERTGHRHVYLYNLNGTLLGDLTPADLEVSRLSPAVDSSDRVYVGGSTGNHQDLQLFRLESEKVAATQLTSEAGWHEVMVSSTGNAFVDRYSTAMKPASIWWHPEKGEPRLLARSSSTEKPVVNEFVPIKTHDNVLLPARLFKPDDFDAGKKYPVILYTFSGPRGHVVADSWDGWQMAWNRYMVRKGFLVLAVDVRGSGGYSHLFEEYIHYRLGAQEMADLREVVSYLRRQTYIDAERLGIWGCDYGAHTVIHAMLEFPGGFKAGFADSPIVDWRQYDAYFAERYLGLPHHRKNEYDDSSALESARRITGDLLVAATPSNFIISPAHLQALQTAMAEARQGAVAKRLRVVTMKDVAYRSRPNQLVVLWTAMTEFFDEKLMPVH